jgi:hypothetical protein
LKANHPTIKKRLKLSTMCNIRHQDLLINLPYAPNPYFHLHATHPNPSNSLPPKPSTTHYLTTSPPSFPLPHQPPVHLTTHTQHLHHPPPHPHQSRRTPTNPIAPSLIPFPIILSPTTYLPQRKYPTTSSSALQISLVRHIRSENRFYQRTV